MDIHFIGIRALTAVSSNTVTKAPQVHLQLRPSASEAVRSLLASPLSSPSSMGSIENTRVQNHFPDLSHLAALPGLADSSCHTPAF